MISVAHNLSVQGLPYIGNVVDQLDWSTFCLSFI